MVTYAYNERDITIRYLIFFVLKAEKFENGGAALFFL